MTAQVADSVTIDGEPWLLLETPLDGLLARIDAPDYVAPHTANWRGYVAQWRVEGDVLSLVGVEATVAGPDGRPTPISGRDALGGVGLPLVADWVTGTMRVARGDQVRHVHQGFGSRWAEEVLLEVERGRVVARTVLDAPGPMGSAGPYRLMEPLLAGVSGGAFGQVVLAQDLDGADLVAKLPRPRGGGVSATEIFAHDPDGGRRPVHVPAVALRTRAGVAPGIEEADADELESVIEREAEILQRDGGRLLPRSFGTWEHDPQGTPVLVMERLVGRRPERLADVEAILHALADAVDRGTFEAHGDVKPEHVFIADDGRVRLCDPAPRFGDPSRRGYTPTYNPRGHAGPAADVAACATILRHLVDDAPAAWGWCAALLDDETPPPWAASHRSALEALREAVAAGVAPPPGWSPPPLPGRTEHLAVVAGTRPRARDVRDAGDPGWPGPGATVDVWDPPPPLLLPGWSRSTAVRIDSPDGIARVEVEDEPAGDARTTEDLVERAQQAVRALPGFEELAEPTSYLLAGGAVGWSQRYRFTAPDGRSLDRIVVYRCHEGRSRTVSGTAPSQLWHRHLTAVVEAVDRLLLDPRDGG